MFSQRARTSGEASEVRRVHLRRLRCPPGARNVRSIYLPVLLLVALLAVSGSAGWAASHAAASKLAPTGAGEVRSLSLTPLTISGSWVVQGWVNESYTAVAVSGNVIVDSGGHLQLSSASLTIVEPWNLDFGVQVEPGGSLTLTATDLASSPSYDHTYLQAWSESTLRVSGGVIADVGGNVSTEQGVYLSSNGASISDTTFENYYEAIVVASATNVDVTGVTILGSTSDSDWTTAVDVFGASSGFQLTHSTLNIPQNIEALWIDAPHATISNNVFELDAWGSGESGIYFSYTNDGAQAASYSSFDNNSVTGSGFIVQGASYVTVWGNWIHDTGPARPYGIMVEVNLWTQAGIWAHNIAIEWNTISDYSRYGIRLQQNVSDFSVAHNTIVQPSTDPGPAWTEQWGGPQTDAIYLIRGVDDGVVLDNYIDDSDTWYIATNGITLESDVSNVRIIGNQLYNVSQEAIVLQGDVPGFDNAEPWQNGPSLWDTVSNNLFDNERRVSETNFTVEAILLWHWANHTTIVNNTFIGWENVPTDDYFNGAIVLTTASYGFYYNNTVDGARYGFVFTNFSGIAHPYWGEFNRSYNLVYGNFLSGITVAPVEETPNDGLGPLHNVIVALSNPSIGPGVPTSYVESIANAATLMTKETGGTYTETLRTASPITGVVQNFTTWLDWSNNKFSVTATGGVGSGVLTLTPWSLTGASVGFTISASWSSTATVNLYPAGGSYTGHYNVSITRNQVETSYTAYANGPIGVSVASGVSSVDVRLLSYTTGGPAQYELLGDVVARGAGTPVAGATVAVDTGATTYSNATGGYELSLPNGSYRLSVQAPGLVASGTSVTIAGSDAWANFALDPLLYNVSGTVTDGTTSGALAGVSVAILGEATTQTDDNGSYLLTVANGTYDLEASDPGFNSTVVQLWVVGGGVEQNFSLEPANATSPGGGGAPTSPGPSPPGTVTNSGSSPGAAWATNLPAGLALIAAMAAGVALFALVLYRRQRREERP
jgi:Carboxypeptidase regulatory-like domain/Right handed beta helix region